MTVNPISKRLDSLVPGDAFTMNTPAELGIVASGYPVDPTNVAIFWPATGIATQADGSVLVVPESRASISCE